jgi:beta-lactamase class A
MKRGNVKVAIAAMVLGVMFCAPVASASATEGTATEIVAEEVTEQTTEQAALNGWVTKKSKKYYYENGSYVTGWKKINGKSYYFNSKGVMQKNKMISKNKYVNSKGVLVPKSKIYSLGKNSLKSLKKKLKKEIKGYSGTYEIYVKNLDTNEYMVINNKKMKTASIIKLYNMGTVYDQISKKKLKSSKQINSYLNSMITVSSNDAYNELLQKIGHGSVRKGIKTITKFCKQHGYKSTNAGGTLSPTYFKSVWLSSSYSTPQDCGHILEDIYRGNLVSEKASKKMLSLLKKQTRKGKIPAGLPKGVKSANKTGEYETRQHDAAIVFSKKADYVIVIMSEGDGAAISHIQKLSRITYKYFN